MVTDRLETHATVGANALRAAVLGVNDGLVSNLSLVMGVAGAEVRGSTIVITGLAGLVAGASSMAMGEWISVQSARELHLRDLAVERSELAREPVREHAELVAMFAADGVPERVAREAADGVMADPELALEVMARQELGFDARDLGGSAWTAAGSSFLLFVLGAVVPVLPFVLLDGTQAIVLSVVLSALGLLTIGASVTRITHRSAVPSALRQLAMGMAAAAVTYGVGAFAGVRLG
jgi:vacuolar iron transporter family protein